MLVCDWRLKWCKNYNLIGSRFIFVSLNISPYLLIKLKSQNDDLRKYCRKALYCKSSIKRDTRPWSSPLQRISKGDHSNIINYFLRCFCDLFQPKYRQRFVQSDDSIGYELCTEGSDCYTIFLGISSVSLITNIH